ncbi:MAG: sulfatase [Thermoleophilaceae bacterium]
MRCRAAIVVLVLVVLAACAPAAAARRPNVVVIETDDQTPTSLYAMPTVQRLIVRQGVSFDNSFVSFPLCCPSRATFLTGQYAHNHGVRNNKPPNGGFTKLRGNETLPVWLNRAGYRTILVGKYLNGYGERDPSEVPPGWTDWHGLVDPTTYRYYGFTINDDGHPHHYVRRPRNYQTHVLTNKAVKQIRRASGDDRPFFMWTTYVAPHFAFDSPHKPIPTPVPAPQDRGDFAGAPLPGAPSYNEADVSDKPATIRQYPRLNRVYRAAIRTNWERELESLQAVDRGVGRIVQALRDHHELGHTILVFTSDNGYIHGEHRVPFGKLLPYEESIRVPLVIRGPDLPHDVHVGALASNQDLAPTILDATGAEAGLTEDGVSLMPLMRGGTLPDRDLLIEGFYSFGVRVHYAAVRTERWFYAEYTNGERELYDLASDPDELENLASSPYYQDVEADLANRLAALRTCSGKGCLREDAPGGAAR